MSDLHAKGSPEKSFFVRMLTRDISLDDCILDLVDNSIDGAWVTSGEDPSTLTIDDALSDFSVDINISEEQFSISDNCGGITLNDAMEYAFTFGRRDEQEAENFTVGVYGIGMKRAVFKMGRAISIDSTFYSEGTLESFTVPIDVNEWLKPTQTSWDFDIEESETAEEAGVEIRVEELTEETSRTFSDPTYDKSLRRVLARDYMVPLMRGLQMRVNDVVVEGWDLELHENEDFSPMRDQYEDDGVSIEIIAGMASPPPDDREPDEQRRTQDISGWYVLCNGRVVLAADTTVLTGWNSMLPKWHKQYSGFVGVVLFSAEDPSLLPMTTTKRSVDVLSSVYNRALAKMYDPTRAWIDYTNARKQDLESAKTLEEAVTSKDLSGIERRTAFGLPILGQARTKERMANVHYSVRLIQLRELASELGDSDMSYRDVGLESFKFAYENYVGTDGSD